MFFLLTSLKKLYLIFLAFDSKLSDINILDIDLNKDETTEEAVIYNVEQNIGKDISELVYDYKIITTSANKFSQKLKVIFVSMFSVQ